MSQFTPYRTNGDDERVVNNHDFERSTDFPASDHRYLACSPRHDDIPTPGASANAPLVHGSATMASMDGATRLNGLSGSNRFNGAIVPAAAAETHRGPTTANGIATAGAISAAEWKPHAALARFNISDDDLRQKKRRKTDNDDEAKSPSVGVSLGGPAATTGGISFGGPVAPSPATPVFTFGAPIASMQLREPAEPPRAPAFTFGSAAPAAAKPSVTFAATPKASESIPSFSFASGSKTPTPSIGSNLFAGHIPGVSTAPFGGSSTPAPPFSFSGGSSTPVPPSYSFQAASTPATPSFGNGSSIPAQNTNPFSSGSTSAPSLGNTPGDTTTPSVSFGATPAPSVSFSATSAQSIPFGTTPTPSLSFGCAAPASPGVSFGASPAPLYGGARKTEVEIPLGGQMAKETWVKLKF